MAFSAFFGHLAAYRTRGQVRFSFLAAASGPIIAAEDNHEFNRDYQR
jgi:hypothetical protein